MIYSRLDYKARAAKGFAGPDVLPHSRPTWPKGGLCPRVESLEPRVIGLDPSWSVHIPFPALSRCWYIAHRERDGEAGTLDKLSRIIHQISHA